MKLILASLFIGGVAMAAPAPVNDLSKGSLESRVATLERLVEARHVSQRTILVQLDEMQQEVSGLRGTVELHNHKLEQILQRQRELYLEIDKRMEQLKTPVAPVVQAPVAEDNFVMASGETEAYERAVNLILKDKRYDQAISEFASFLKTYPESSYAANAHYWMGQLLFTKKDWEGAKQHFSTVVSNYQDSTKRSDSLLKLGAVAQNQGNLARAKQLFEQVVSEYPDSASRKLAENRLRELP